MRFFGPPITPIFINPLPPSGYWPLAGGELFSLPEVLQSFDDGGFDLVEALQDGVFLSFVVCDVAA